MQLSALPRRPASATAVHAAGALPRHAVAFRGIQRKGGKSAGVSHPLRISAASSSSEDLPPGAASAAAAAEAPPAAAAAAEGEAPASSPSEPEQNPEYLAALAAADGDDSRAFAVAMAREAWDTKAEDILVLHVAPLVYWTRYMVLATVFSKPQLNALLAKMTRQAKEVFGRTLSHNVEGRSAWELLDYGDVVVHVMTAEQREYYDLEGFYGAAEDVELPFLTDGSEQGAAWQKRLG